jgi:hypothetical protein
LFFRSAKKIVDSAMSLKNTSENSINTILCNVVPLCEAFSSNNNSKTDNDDEAAATLKAFVADVLTLRCPEEKLLLRLELVKKALDNDDDGKTSEVMGESVAQVLIGQLKEHRKRDEKRRFEATLDVLAQLPTKYLEQVTDLNSDISLRHRIALSLSGKESSLVWLNSCVDIIAGSDSIVEEDAEGHLFRCFFSLVTQKRSKRAAANKQWLLELMGQARSASRAANNGSFPVLFQLLCLSACTFSETDVFLNPTENKMVCKDATERLRLLPLSVARLLASSGETWRPFGVQLAEWMMTMRSEDAAGGMLACFPAYKYADKYKEPTMWSRLVPIK